MTTQKHRVVIVGGGFGGLSAAMELKGADVEITLVDRRNHHLFQPLLYQVATAALSTSEIAWPIRTILRDRREVRTILGTVMDIDTGARQVRLEDGTVVPYDSLILATGARHAYFGHDEWEADAPGLKTLEDATTIRRKLLEAFEAAERTLDPHQRAALMTFVVIGAGPTGVELAGAISELARAALRDEFRTIDPREARVHLIEGADRVLLNFDKDLSAYAEEALKRLGVIVELGENVSEVDKDGVTYGGKRLEAKTVIWAAGVQASPVAKWLGAEADRAGRIKVEPDLSVPGNPEIFVIGDAATIAAPDGKPVPGIGDAAKQGGRHAAKVIKARLAGDTAPMPFRYKHLGSLATIGKRAAVIDFGWLKLKGRLAWWVWGLAHIYFLIDAKNRFSVALSWLWIYLTGRRSARLITQGPAEKAAPLKEVTKAEG
ncbi:NADH dehydrogenase [Devosia geojensis]|uniref:NADH:ubiquinone reductase (non-electrogenic) n=1 Tax=Devosia geojensis TaxID=443610 RepID=A0A0F5FTJ4_9HYPH|nr:NAD(P)/FAD-dependent oxidoreductase [Devosia geojensis]KKB12181.1 NADH dehydrogenase [Devosia geojensis]